MRLRKHKPRERWFIVGKYQTLGFKGCNSDRLGCPESGMAVNHEIRDTQEERQEDKKTREGYQERAGVLLCSEKIRNIPPDW